MFRYTTHDNDVWLTGVDDVGPYQSCMANFNLNNESFLVYFQHNGQECMMSFSIEHVAIFEALSRNAHFIKNVRSENGQLKTIQQGDLACVKAAYHLVGGALIERPIF